MHDGSYFKLEYLSNLVKYSGGILERPGQPLDSLVVLVGYIDHPAAPSGIAAPDVRDIPAPGAPHHGLSGPAKNPSRKFEDIIIHMMRMGIAYRDPGCSNIV